MGTVAGIRDDRTAAVSFSSIGAKHRLAAWLRVVALSAAHPETPWRAMTVGKHKRGARALEHGPIAGPPAQRATTARALLTEIVALRESGLCEPLPLPCKTAAAWADARRRRRPPEKSALRDWESNYLFDQEDRDPSHRLVWDGVLRLDQLLAFTPADAEAGPGWAEDEETRLGRLARRLWDPILDHERRP